MDISGNSIGNKLHSNILFYIKYLKRDIINIIMKTYRLYKVIMPALNDIFELNLNIQKSVFAVLCRNC